MQMTPSHPVVPTGRLIIFIWNPDRHVSKGEHEAGQPGQAHERRVEAHPGDCGRHRPQREVLQGTAALRSVVMMGSPAGIMSVWSYIRPQHSRNRPICVIVVESRKGQVTAVQAK